MDVRLSLPQGQQQARDRWNTQESGAAFDRKKTPYLTENAQAFIAQRSFFVMSGIGLHNELDGLLVMGNPGFVQTPDSNACLLRLDHTFGVSPMLQRLLHLSSGEQITRFGLFFICHPTRERLCVQGRAEVLATSTSKLFNFFPSFRSLWVLLHVEQSFFHCAKYVRTKVPGLHADLAKKDNQSWSLQDLYHASQQYLSEEACAFISQQVLCFLCTVDQHGQAAVNHRGGAPGFLVPLPPGEKSPGGSVLLPDYAGNGAFEALSNILETGQVTLVVPCYATYQALCISGTASIMELDELPKDIEPRCLGAERVVTLSVQRVALQHGDWTQTIAHERRCATSLRTADESLFECLIDSSVKPPSFKRGIETSPCGA